MEDGIDRRNVLLGSPLYVALATPDTINTLRPRLRAAARAVATGPPLAHASMQASAQECRNIAGALGHRNYFYRSVFGAVDD